MGEHDLGGVTVPQYLARLATEATTIINAYDYGRSVYDLAMRRELISIGEDVVNVAYDAPVDSSPREQIEEAERRLYQIAETGRYDGGFQRFLRRAEDRGRHGRPSLRARGVSLRHCDGPHRSRPVHGRPAGLRPRHPRGAPWHGQDGARHQHRLQHRQGLSEPRTRADGTVETANGGIVGFFSLEMSAEQLATRIIAEQSGVASYKIRRGDITESDFHRVAEAVGEMQQIPFYIDQTGGISIAQLTARARRLKRQKGLDLLVVDYLQLLSGSKTRSDNRVQELTEITTGLKALAKELGVPILALSQLSRQVEQRDDKRPQLSDLRESGSIEQDADVVLFVFREEYYLKNKEPRPGTEEHIDWMAQMESAHGRAEVIIGKQRHGPTGTIELQFDAEVTRFSTLAREDTIAEIR